MEPMNIYILTAFPDMIKACLAQSMFRKAMENGSVNYNVWDLRDFTHNKHRQIDDKPYGGGAGMILKPEPFFRAYDKLAAIIDPEEARILFPSPQGERFTYGLSQKLSREKDLVFFAGHYKGVDQRVIDQLVTDEISIGDYILTGGELPTLVMLDAIIRHVPGVLHAYESAESDSFADDLLEGPIYTHPREYRGWEVPEILLSGDHGKIAAWRRSQRVKRTQERRSDLLNKNIKDKKSIGGNNG